MKESLRWLVLVFLADTPKSAKIKIKYINIFLTKSLPAINFIHLKRFKKNLNHLNLLINNSFISDENYKKTNY